MCTSDKFIIILNKEIVSHLNKPENNTASIKFFTLAKNDLIISSNHCGPSTEILINYIWAIDQITLA